MENKVCRDGDECWLVGLYKWKVGRHTWKRVLYTWKSLNMEVCNKDSLYIYGKGDLERPASYSASRAGTHHLSWRSKMDLGIREKITQDFLCFSIRMTTEFS